MRTILAVTLLAGCTDYNLNGPAVHEGKYNPPDLTTPTQTDEITQVTIPAVDVLWVIDNSGSMSEEQRALRENFTSFMQYFTDSGLDYHVGVVSTDMDNRKESGKLIDDSSHSGRYIDSSMSGDEAIASFRDRADLGTNGSSDERGKDAAFAALTTEADRTNVGFYRPDASLSVVVISDELDYSRISVTEFVNWMLDLKPKEGMASFSSIVGLTNNDCMEAEKGTGYLETTAQVGGIKASICDSDWSGVLTELGLQAAGLKREFYLSLRPVEETIAVSVTTDGDEESFDQGDDWTYDPARNSITFVAYVPDPLSVVNIDYEVLASSQNTSDSSEE